MRRRIALVSGVAVLLLCAAVSRSGSGELDSYSITSYVEWTPDGCSKPSRPFLAVYDRFSYNMAVEEFNAYLGRARSYVACARREADNDLVVFQRALSSSVDRIAQETVRDVESLRSDLDLQRIMLR